jgi:hypothetical protein
MPDQQSGFRRITDPPPATDQETIERGLGMVLERIDGMAEAALTPKDVATAVRDGITAALADPATWSAAFGGIQASTEDHAGKWMVGAVWSVMRKLALFALAGMLVYSIGGWTALSAVWKAIWGHQP